MPIRQTLRSAAVVALLAALPVLAAPAVEAGAQSDRATTVADPGWGVAPVVEPSESAPADAGWG